MTDREREVYSMILENPMISQEELSETLGIARSSVGVHISNLMKKGYILGKGYVVNEEPYILVIGGANIDIEGYPLGALKMKDSNPGVVKRSFGGVGRNIAENLARVGIKTRLITLVGEDSSGRELLKYSVECGIDISGSERVEDASTSTYLSILGTEKDMEVAISHMDIMDRLDVDFIKKRHSLIKGAKVCVLDTNLPKETIEYLLNNFDTPFAIDTVSLEKSRKIEGLYNKIDTLKPNLLEAEAISGVKIEQDRDVERAAELILEKGINNLFISLGSKGVYYASKEYKGYLYPPKVDVVSSTGAGDAFIAGVLSAQIEDKNVIDQGMQGIAMSVCALKSEKNISENLNYNKMIEELEEVTRCNYTTNI